MVEYVGVTGSCDLCLCDGRFGFVTVVLLDVSMVIWCCVVRKNWFCEFAGCCYHRHNKPNVTVISIQQTQPPFTQQTKWLRSHHHTQRDCHLHPSSLFLFLYFVLHFFRSLSSQSRLLSFKGSFLWFSLWLSWLGSLFSFSSFSRCEIKENISCYGAYGERWQYHARKARTYGARW